MATMRSKSCATVDENFPCFGIVAQYFQGEKQGQAVTKITDFRRIGILSNLRT